MSMNKTCPISNFTSEECSDGMNFLLSQNSRFNELFRFKTSLSPTGDLYTLRRFSWEKKLRGGYLIGGEVFCGAREVTILSKRGSLRSESNSGSSFSSP